jgi:hypothetical protein
MSRLWRNSPDCSGKPTRLGRGAWNEKRDFAEGSDADALQKEKNISKRRCFLDELN